MASAAVSGVRLLELVWVDDQGVPYHTAHLTAAIARMALEKELPTLFIDGQEVPLGLLSWAAANRSRRALVARLAQPPLGREVIITPVWRKAEGRG